MSSPKELYNLADEDEQRNYGLRSTNSSNNNDKHSPSATMNPDWEERVQVGVSPANFENALIPGYQLNHQIYCSLKTTVFLATQVATKKQVVIKIIRETIKSGALSTAKREQDILFLLSANNIDRVSKVIEVHPLPNAEGAAIVMEYAGVSLASSHSNTDYDSEGYPTRGTNSYNNSSDEENYSNHSNRNNNNNNDNNLVDNKAKVIQALEIGAKLAKILVSVHGVYVIHNDIKPSNILIDKDTGDITLIDFGISEVLSRENPEKVASTLRGSLGYISPEQTGRLQKKVDFRSDLYSLGCTLFELLTGRFPFTEKHPLELVHAHIAKTPPSPSSINPAVPLAVSSIILKLLEKDPEKRYQSAYGLMMDLQRCLTDWQRARASKGAAVSLHDAILPFPLGQAEQFSVFRIPSKLYGRDKEISEIRSIFARICHGSCEMLCISGGSGSGKSALVREAYDQFIKVNHNINFQDAKLDQYRRSVPYAAFIQAFKVLVGQILSRSSDELEFWKERLQRYLGPQDAQVIIDVIPDLEFIIGKQPPVSKLPPDGTLNRFNIMFLRLISAFCEEKRPLILFIDDITWADQGTLRLINFIMTSPDLHHFMLIATYRTEEVGPSHPVALVLDEIRETNIVPLHSLQLNNMHIPDLNRFLSDTMHCPLIRSLPVAELVAEKTGGNPFFTVQFIKRMYKEGLLMFDEQAQQWICDIPNARKKLGLTDNMIDFMIRDIASTLSKEALELLQVASCIGVQADIHVLARYKGCSAAKIREVLSEAERQGHIAAAHNDWTFQFAHDKIHQAIYSTISAEMKSDIHMRLGKQFYKVYCDGGTGATDEQLFEAVIHLNTALGLHGDQLVDESSPKAKIEERLWKLAAEEDTTTTTTTAAAAAAVTGGGHAATPLTRIGLTELNIEAAERAKGATAYDFAIQYFHAAVSLLGYTLSEDQQHEEKEQKQQQQKQHEDGDEHLVVFPAAVKKKLWDDDERRVLVMRAFFGLAECEYQRGSLQVAQRVLDEIIANARSTLDKAQAYHLQIMFFENRGQFDDAINIGRQCLELFGFDLKHHVVTASEENETVQDGFVAQTQCIDGLLKGSVETMRAIPPAAAGDDTITKTLMLMVMSAKFKNQHLANYIVLSAMTAQFEYGSTIFTPLVIAWYGVYLAESGKHLEGYKCGKLAQELAVQNDDKLVTAKVFMICAAFLDFRVEPLHDIPPRVADAYEKCILVGDNLFASYGACIAVVFKIMCGENLSLCHEELKRWKELCRHLHNGQFVHMMSAIEDFITIMTTNVEQHQHQHDHEVAASRKYLLALQQQQKQQQQQYKQQQITDLDELAASEAFVNAGMPIPSIHYVFRMMAYYLNGEFDNALKCINYAQKYLQVSNSLVNQYEHLFYHSLVLAALYPDLQDEEDKKSYIAIMRRNQQELRQLSQCNPHNFQCKYLLVEAQLAEILDHPQHAQHLYIQAIQSASDNNFPHVIAIGCEIAAKFFIKQGLTMMARLHLWDCSRFFFKWGSASKCSRLAAKYPGYLNSSSTSSLSTSPFNSWERSFVVNNTNHSHGSGSNSRRNNRSATTATTTVTDSITTKDGTVTSALDTTAIIKLSQALSKEIVLKKLLSILIKVVTTNTGGTHGVLILCDVNDESKLTVEARYDATANPTPSHHGEKSTTKSESGKNKDNDQGLGIPLASCTDVCQSVVNFVARMHRPVVLNDATNDGLFVDSYIIAKKPKSIVCIPIIRSKLIGVIYVENNLTTGVFTEERVMVLNLLSSQIAISIENARLYHNLAQYSKELEQVASHLEDLQERNKAILDNTADGILMISSQGDILTINKSAERILGIASVSSSSSAANPSKPGDNEAVIPGGDADGDASSSVIGKNFKDVLLMNPLSMPESIQDLVGRTVEFQGKRLRLMVAPNGNNNNEERHQTTTTTTMTTTTETEAFPGEMRVSSLSLRGEVYYVAMLRDITEIKQGLELLIRAKQLEAENRAKTAFISTLSHEIRNPLSGIQGMNQLLFTTNLTQEQLEYVTSSQSAAELLETIISDILDYSKSAANKLDFQHVEFNIIQQVESVADWLAPVAMKKNLDFVMYASPAIPQLVVGDSTRVRQIVINILINAIKFTSEGYVALEIDLEEETDTDVKLHFVFRDTGIGVKPEQRSKLFKAFSQADGAQTTHEYGGTGLGLAISKQLVEYMKGEIGVMDNYEDDDCDERRRITTNANNAAPERRGRGSAFWFTIRLDKSPASTPTSATSVIESYFNNRGVPPRMLDYPSDSGSGPIENGKQSSLFNTNINANAPISVLVVDSCVMTRRCIAKYLSFFKPWVTCHTCATWKEAMNMLRQRRRHSHHHANSDNNNNNNNGSSSSSNSNDKGRGDEERQFDIVIVNRSMHRPEKEASLKAKYPSIRWVALVGGNNNGSGTGNATSDSGNKKDTTIVDIRHYSNTLFNKLQKRRSGSTCSTSSSSSSSSSSSGGGVSPSTPMIRLLQTRRPSLVAVVAESHSQTSSDIASLSPATPNIETMDGPSSSSSSSSSSSAEFFSTYLSRPVKLSKLFHMLTGQPMPPVLTKAQAKELEQQQQQQQQQKEQQSEQQQQQQQQEQPSSSSSKDINNTTTTPSITMNGTDEEQQQQQQQQHRKHKMLLVEDNRLNQRVIVKMLEKAGYECDVANDGVECIELVERNTRDQYSLIFMDLMMPRLSGYDAAKQLHERHKSVLSVAANNKNDATTTTRNDTTATSTTTTTTTAVPPILVPPIVALTANALKEDLDKCYECGMVDVITKPCKYDQLLDMIDKWVLRRPTQPINQTNAVVGGNYNAAFF